VVAGCVAQQEGEQLLRRVPEVDLIIGPQHANRLGDLLQQVFDGSQVVATEPIHIMEDITKPRRDSNITAWVNVIYVAMNAVPIVWFRGCAGWNNLALLRQFEQKWNN